MRSYSVIYKKYFIKRRNHMQVGYFKNNQDLEERLHQFCCVGLMYQSLTHSFCNAMLEQVMPENYK
jgi:hypothetical protein